MKKTLRWRLVLFQQLCLLFGILFLCCSSYTHSNASQTHTLHTILYGTSEHSNRTCTLSTRGKNILIDSRSDVKCLTRIREKNANKRTVTKNSFLALLAHHLFRFTHKYFADDVLNSSFNATFNESNYSFVQFILYMVVLIIFVTLDDKNIKIHHSIVTERTLKLLANSIEM